MVGIEALPVDRELYADVFDKGGLAPALEEAAQRRSIDLGPISADGYHQYWTVGIESNRGTVRVSMGAAERVFSISIATDLHQWADGSTSELSGAVDVADAWRKGVTLRELHDRFSFMTYSRIAQAHEDGDPLEATWDELLTSEASALARPLLQAARANERLGGLSAAVSHNNLVMFFVGPGDKDQEQVRILLGRDGTYYVTTTWNDSHQSVTSIDDAIDAAVALLP
jgi:hypothetical protein